MSAMPTTRTMMATAALMLGLVIAGDAQQPSREQSSQQTPPVMPTFKSSIELVRVSAFVRDRKGRFVTDLRASDFEVLEDGRPRVISDFRHQLADVSVALLFDISGSMEARMGEAREAAQHLLSWLKEGYDEAAVYTFDTTLDEVRRFDTKDLQLPERLSTVRPFGATSLHDAIALAAEKVGARPSLRRAVVVFTDGRDTASRLTAAEVSGIASQIDVPVYILGLVPAIDNPADDLGTVSVNQSALMGTLGNLAAWTGGESFVVDSISERSAAARRIVDELRHQYLMAFEASAEPGWHPLLVRMRDRDLTVRARSGYFAGRSRPTSH